MAGTETVRGGSGKAAGTETVRRQSGKRARKKSRRPHLSWKLSIAAVLAAAVVIVSAVTALRGRDRLAVEESVYTCMGGQTFTWPDGVELLHGDGRTVLRCDDRKEQIDNYPLVAEDGSLIIQRDMSLTRTDNSHFYRVDYFTRVCPGENGAILKKGGREVTVSSGFLYDNEDTYIFLEPATLTFDDRTVELGAFTVVQVRYRQAIQIYGPGAETVFVYLDGEEVRAVFENGKKVDLATDTFFEKNGEWRLLFMPLEALMPVGQETE